MCSCSLSGYCFWLLSSVFKPLAELAALKLGELAGALPGLGRGVGDHFGGDVIHRMSHRECGLPHGWLRAKRRPEAEVGGAFHRFLRAFAFGFVAQAEEQIGDGDIDGADFVARPAEAGSFRQVGQFRETVAGEQRAEHGADGAGIHAAVGVAAGLAVDRADVEAGAATDAAEDLAAVAGQHFCTAVVDEDDVRLLRAVRLAGGFGAADELVVNGELLAGARATDQVEEEPEVAVGGDEFFDADYRDVDFIGRYAEAGVAFVRHEHDTAALSGDEVATGQADVSIDVFLAEVFAGAAGDGCRVVVIVLADALTLECLGDTAAVFVHDGRDDVGRVIVIKLQDEFAKVGFDDFLAVLLEVFEHVDLFGHHALGFDHALGAVLLHDAEDAGVDRVIIDGEVHLDAVALESGFGLFEVGVEMFERVLLDQPGGFAELVGVVVVAVECVVATLGFELRAHEVGLVDFGVEVARCAVDLLFGLHGGLNFTGVLEGVAEDLHDVHTLLREALFLHHAAEVHHAAHVGRRHDVGLAGGELLDLECTHAIGNVGKADRESAAEAAALFRLVDWLDGEAFDRAE